MVRARLCGKARVAAGLPWGIFTPTAGNTGPTDVAAAGATASGEGGGTLAGRLREGSAITFGGNKNENYRKSCDTALLQKYLFFSESYLSSALWAQLNFACLVSETELTSSRRMKFQWTGRQSNLYAKRVKDGRLSRNSSGPPEVEAVFRMSVPVKPGPTPPVGHLCPDGRRADPYRQFIRPVPSEMRRLMGSSFRALLRTDL